MVCKVLFLLQILIVKKLLNELKNIKLFRDNHLSEIIIFLLIQLSWKKR